MLGAVGAGLSGAGCSGDDDGPSAESPLGLGEDGVETCLRFDDTVGAVVDELPVIDCTEPHTHEIYAVEIHPADLYPGFTELEVFAQQVCLAAFEPYVETNPFDSTLFHTWMVPTLDSWNDTPPDREILCILGAHDGELLTDSMRGSRR